MTKACSQHRTVGRNWSTHMRCTMTPQQLLDCLEGNDGELQARRDRALAALEIANERLIQHAIRKAIAKDQIAHLERFLPGPSLRGALRHSHYVGAQSRVAKSLGVSRSFVCRVMKGQKKSARVSAALNREYSRIERLVSLSQRRSE